MKKKLGDILSHRFLQSFPGILSWVILFLAILLIIIQPYIFVFLLLVFSIYWVFNCAKIVLNAYLCYMNVQNAKNVNWLEKLKQDFPDTWNEYYYCAIIPFASESVNILRPTIQSIADSDFPKDKKILCLSSEKAIPCGQAISEQFRNEFKDFFAHIFITEHELKPGEIKGKSSNQNHCGRFLYDKIQDLNIDPAKVLISSNDADVLNDNQYHTYLLHKFLSEGENNHCRIYQPIPTDFTNYWNAKFFSRLIIITGALWRMALQHSNNHRCTVYSFYSMSLKMLKDIDFWDVDLIPEDERTMFKALFRFGSKFKVVPMFILTTGNSIQGLSVIDTFIEQYKQIRRWAWGASEFAYSVKRVLTCNKVDYKVVFRPILNQLRISTEWALSSLLLLFGGILPGVINSNFAETQFAQIYPMILSSILSSSSILIILLIILELKIIPKKFQSRGFFRQLVNISQWIFMPIIGFVFSSIPAFEAQTRLIFNRPIVYVESKKGN